MLEKMRCKEATGFSRIKTALVVMHVATCLAFSVNATEVAAQANQRPALAVQTDTRAEFQTLSELLVSSNIVGRDRIIDRLREPSEIPNDIQVLKHLVTSGEAGDYAATFLAIRQIPFTSSEGYDIISEMSARINQIARATIDPTVRTVTYCPESGSCNMAPLTQSELTVAVGGGREGAPALPAMLPNRSLPVNRPVAAINGFLDAQMNADRYRTVLANGQTLSLPETVADMQSRTPASVTNEQLASCLANENTYSISQCAIAGNRAGLAFNNDSGVIYSGAQFLGTVQPPGRSD